MSNMIKKIKKNIHPTYIEFICPKCKIKEQIPFEVVDMMDRYDNGDPSYPPRFNCEHCNGLMEPIYYKTIKELYTLIKKSK